MILMAWEVFRPRPQIAKGSSRFVTWNWLVRPAMNLPNATASPRLGGPPPPHSAVLMPTRPRRCGSDEQPLGAKSARQRVLPPPMAVLLPDKRATSRSLTATIRFLFVSGV